MAFAPLVDGLEHAARVLDVPKDAAVGCALVGAQALEPVRVPLPPIPVRDGVVLIPPGSLSGQDGIKCNVENYKPVGHGDIAVAHNGLPQEIEAVI